MRRAPPVRGGQGRCVLAQGGVGARPEAVVVEVVSAHTDRREPLRQQRGRPQPPQRGQQVARGQVTGGAEQHERRRGAAHGCSGRNSARAGAPSAPGMSNGRQRSRYRPGRAARRSSPPARRGPPQTAPGGRPGTPTESWSTQRQRLHSPAAVDEVHRGVDVGAGVRAHVQPGDVGRVTCSPGAGQLHRETRISGEGLHVRLQGPGGVDPARQARGHRAPWVRG